jgi:integrase
MKLTNLACQNAKPAAKQYKFSDGGGLYLRIMPNGSKLWQMKYKYLGVEKVLSFGSYPVTSLLEAREQRDNAKKLLRQGQDPMALKKDEKRKAALNARNTFKATALEWHEVNKGKWSEGHGQYLLHLLETDVFPAIGLLPIADIKAPDLLDALKKIEKRGALDTVSRARQVCGQVFRYGNQIRRCEHNPAPSLQGALKTRKTRHFAAIESDGVRELVRAIHRNDARLMVRTRNALLLSLLTFVRPGELRQARWEEIDFDKAEWRIPAERMKMRRPHIVPLSKQAIAVLKDQQVECGLLQSPWVFPSQRGHRHAMSDGTVLGALKRLGFRDRMTAHGFRALARTTIREELDYQPDIIEAQLAHKASGPLGEAYDRAKFLGQRRVMMQDWADHIDRITTGGEVIHADFKQKA